MATLDSAITTRTTLAFTSKALPALDNHLGAHARSSFAAFVLQEHENRPDLSSVGCTNRSAPPQVPISGGGFCASERLDGYLLVLGY
jgi:hypothetical protein